MFTISRQRGSSNNINWTVCLHSCCVEISMCQQCVIFRFTFWTYYVCNLENRWNHSNSPCMQCITYKSIQCFLFSCFTHYQHMCAYLINVQPNMTYATYDFITNLLKIWNWFSVYTEMIRWSDDGLLELDTVWCRRIEKRQLP